MTEIDDVVRRLVEQHCPGELADAILDDAHDLDALIRVCGRISGGDPVSIRVILSEVADNLTPADVNAILDGPVAPAAAFAERVRTLHDRLRTW
jgi:hypothetical protein